MKFTVPLSSIIELLGLLAVVFGAYEFDWRAAVVVGGLVIVLIGLALDGPVKPKGPSR